MECRLQDYLASDQFEVLKQSVNKHDFEYKMYGFVMPIFCKKKTLKTLG